MLKNITLSAEEHLIRAAREKAQHEHTTLNAAFRQWLVRYVQAGKTPVITMILWHRSTMPDRDGLLPGMR